MIILIKNINGNYNIIGNKFYNNNNINNNNNNLIFILKQLIIL